MGPPGDCPPLPAAVGVSGFPGAAVSPPAIREKSEWLAAEAPGGRGPLTFQPVAGGVRVNNGDGPVTSGWGWGQLLRRLVEEAVVNPPGTRLGGLPPQPKAISIYSVTG